MSDSTPNSNAVIRQRLSLLVSIPSGPDFEWNDFAPRSAIDSIDDPSLFSEIVATLEKVSNRGVHHFLAFLLGRLWKNTSDPRICKYLIDRYLEDPKGPTSRHFASNLSKLPAAESLRLSTLLSEPYRKIWGDVLNALETSESECCEDAVLSVLQSTHSTYDRRYACRVLGRINSTKSLSQIREVVFDKDGDTAYAALGAIVEILRADGSDIYLQLLGDPRFRHKDLATHYTTRYCKAEAVPAIINRIKQMTSRERSDGYLWMGRNTFTDCIEFLENQAHGSPEVLKLYQLLRKRWHRLLPEEREYVVANIPAFADVSWSIAGSEGALPAGPHNVEQARGLQLFRRQLGYVQFDRDNPLRHVVTLRAAAPGFADEYSAALRYFPTVRELWLEANDFRDEHLATVGQLLNLAVLRLASPGFTDEGLKQLVSITGLTSLSLCGCLVGDATVAWIRNQCRLQALALNRTRLTEAGCRRLLSRSSAEVDSSRQVSKQADVLSRIGIRKFRFGFFTARDSQSGKTLAEDGIANILQSQELDRANGLSSLEITDVPIGDEGFVGIERLVNLERLCLSRTHVTNKTLANLSTLRRLKLLDVRETSIADDGIRHLLNIPSLAHVYLAGTAITPHGFASVKARIPAADNTSQLA